MSESTFVVVNPASANGKTGRRWVELAARLRGRIGEFEAVMTEAPRQATALVRDALQRGARHIVSVGGDGTHNEAVNGFFADGTPIASDAMLSIIPTGTGGDLRRTLGLPNSAVEAIDYVGREPVRVDAGELTCVGPDGADVVNYFVNISSFGSSGRVVEAVNNTTKVFGGKMSFLLGAAKVSATWRNQRIKITLDPGTADERLLDRKIYLVAVANAKYFGGGMKVAPGAKMSDGLFEVVVMGDLSKAAVLLNTRSIYAGTHVNLDLVDVAPAKVVYAEPADPDNTILIDMDGEQPGRLPATWRILPGSLQLCFGPDTARPR